jgi:hypothetical protein
VLSIPLEKGTMEDRSIKKQVKRIRKIVLRLILFIIVGVFLTFLSGVFVAVPVRRVGLDWGPRIVYSFGFPFPWFIERPVYYGPIVPWSIQPDYVTVIDAFVFTENVAFFAFIAGSIWLLVKKKSYRYILLVLCSTMLSCAVALYCVTLALGYPDFWIHVLEALQWRGPLPLVIVLAFGVLSLICAFFIGYAFSNWRSQSEVIVILHRKRGFQADSPIQIGERSTRS